MRAGQGADFSYCQKAVDWGKVKEDQGIDYIWAQAMHHQSTQDVMYRSHQAGAHAAGKPFGPYLFCYPGNPIQAAQNFCAMIGEHEIRAAADIEVPGLSEPYAYAVLSEMEQLLQYTPFGYTGSALLRALYTTPRMERFMKWIANYTGRPGDFGSYPPPWSWDAHQFTSLGAEFGVVGRVDFDYSPDVNRLLVKPQAQGASNVSGKAVAHNAAQDALIVLNDAGGGLGDTLIAIRCKPWDDDPAHGKVTNSGTMFHLSAKADFILATEDGSGIIVHYPAPPPGSTEQWPVAPIKYGKVA